MSEGVAAGARRVDPIGALMGVGFALMWSSAFSAVKLALADAPPFTLLCVRFLIAGAGAAGIAFALGQRLPKQPRAWLAILMLGLCQNSLYLGLNFKAMTLIPAGLAAIIASSAPLLVALLSRLFLKERLGWIGHLGLAIGFAGVMIIMANRAAGGESLFGLALCVIGAAALAAAALIVRGVDLGTGLLMVVGLQMLVGWLSLIPAALLLEDPGAVRVTPSLAAAFAYVVIVPGVAATLLWFHLVRRIGAAQAAAYHFLNPAFGVVIAALLLGERAGWLDALGVAVVMASILMVQLSPLRMANGGR
jgi:drug/metabolite transporter (DMT)-like permease